MNSVVRDKPILPNRPPNKYIRPAPIQEKAKAMTIGVGLKYGGYGLVMGADQQMTRVGVNKFFETKLFQDVRDERALVLIGAGDLSLAKEVWDSLLDLPIDDVKAAKATLTALLDERGRLYAELPVQLLLGVAAKDEIDLLCFIGKGIHAAGEFSVIGCGDVSLIRYLADRLHTFFSTSKEAIIATTYIIRRAEEYVEDCGGPIDLVVLRPGAEGPSIETIDGGAIEKLDGEIQKQELSAFNALLSVSLPFPIEP